MKFFHRVQVRVFVYPDEDLVEVTQALRDIFPFVLEDEKIAIQSRSAKGFNDKTIKILTVVLEKDRHINAFIKELISNIRGDLDNPSRVDNECNYFLRLDKKALLNGDFFLTDSGDCVHISASIASFPKNKETAISVLKQLF